MFSPANRKTSAFRLLFGRFFSSGFSGRSLFSGGRSFLGGRLFSRSRSSGGGSEAAGQNTGQGFIALTDSAPLIIAKEKGFYAKHGMPDVDVQKQASWGTTRDNLVLAALKDVLAP